MSTATDSVRAVEVAGGRSAKQMCHTVMNLAEDARRLHDDDVLVELGA
jgi:hypothetical protein